MPELPEVNTVRFGFEQTALQLKIITVEVYDDKIIRNASQQEFVDALQGETFIDTYRQGKYFFAILSSGLEILFHLGMTGDLVYYFDSSEQPKYERFRLQFENSMYLGYDDLRKFSNILLINDRQKYLSAIQLGPDALSISLKDFSAIFKNRKKSLKAILMDQRLVAGVGNLYADEICYQAQLHPASVAGALQKSHLQRVHRLMQNILNEACEQDAYYKVYPDNWFWKWRDEKKGCIEGKGLIKKIKIGGRTTYFVEGYQKLIDYPTNYYR